MGRSKPTFEGKYANTHNRLVKLFKKWLAEGDGIRSQNEKTRSDYANKLTCVINEVQELHDNALRVNNLQEATKTFEIFRALKESCTDKKNERTYVYMAKFLEKHVKQLEKEQRAAVPPQAQGQPQAAAPLPPLPPPQAPQAPQQQPAQTQSAAHAPLPRPPPLPPSSGGSGPERPRSNSSDARLLGGGGAANTEGPVSLLREQCAQLRREKDELKTRLQAAERESELLRGSNDAYKLTIKTLEGELVQLKSAAAVGGGTGSSAPTSSNAEALKLEQEKAKLQSINDLLMESYLKEKREKEAAERGRRAADRDGKLDYDRRKEVERENKRLLATIDELRRQLGGPGRSSGGGGGGGEHRGRHHEDAEDDYRSSFTSSTHHKRPRTDSPHPVSSSSPPLRPDGPLPDTRAALPSALPSPAPFPSHHPIRQPSSYPPQPPSPSSGGFAETRSEPPHPRSVSNDASPRGPSPHSREASTSQDRGGSKRGRSRSRERSPGPSLPRSRGREEGVAGSMTWLHSARLSDRRESGGGGTSRWDQPGRQQSHQQGGGGGGGNRYSAGRGAERRSRSRERG